MPTNSPQLNDIPASPAPADAATEHLVHLPKMSATAGVSSQEYVAINVVAVFALLLGFAGIMAFISQAMLLIPLAAIIAGIVAARQIAGSNGTQTGMGIASSGLFLAVGISSFLITSDLTDFYGQQQDKAAIANLCQRFGEDMRDRTFDSAYGLFSRHFKARVTRQAFVGNLSTLQDRLTREPDLGIIVAAEWNGLVEFKIEPDTGAVTATSYINFKYAKNPEGVHPVEIHLRKDGSTWLLEDIPTQFPQKQAAQ